MFIVNGDMFGRYVKIPHILADKGEKFVFKVVGKLQSNTYCSIPIGLGTKDEIIHKDGLVDCLRVIQCGIDETKVLTVALKDCEFIEPRTNADWIRGMSNVELAEFLHKVSMQENLGAVSRLLFDEPCKTGNQYCRQEDFPNSPYSCKDCFKEWLEKEREG